MFPGLLFGCLKIFFCRILDVTLGSLRTILVVREKNVPAALIGFCEVFIWYMIVRDAINFEGPVLPIALSYSAGYASGTYIGGTIAKRLVSGHVTVHCVTSGRDETLPAALRASGYPITVMNVNGSEYGEEKYLILADLDKKQFPAFQALVQSTDARAFVLVQETKQTVRFRRPGK